MARGGDLVDLDPSAGDDQLSWLRRSGEPWVLVITGSDINLRFRSLTILGVVFIHAPEPDILCGSVSGGNSDADGFS